MTTPSDIAAKKPFIKPGDTIASTHPARVKQLQAYTDEGLIPQAAVDLIAADPTRDG